ncbi:hypothetical protein HanRHA438_Chr14g0657941 [Helianthus annuus]|uniref:Uncharacterized protein n=1 Tax=Helianthus annuus TaxID=4232 RepID=A0A9K3H819_HELAN|nr:hypothetical protein HanXRQr2_Chr14g0647371 [Helianthus annuus]KAJ0468909.1 hypothetical protein HanIR_Chr14g0702041 [Helianthus annuus]KAJ0485984.1 hypothetical protein HanHA89_Chr14g0574541 [Helianthus annuus]KAJ0656539.1 hypothetical protein HanLR1_Chr14g0536951 [Helianthus annuus]KAJ0840638.1 hypothetical protein HanPSC8_Chr14g0621071 [Helianthus annuus]
MSPDEEPKRGSSSSDLLMVFLVFPSNTRDAKRGGGPTKVPKEKFVMIISGAKFGGSMFGVPKLAAASFSAPITTPSLHLIGIHIISSLFFFYSSILSK